MPIKSHTIHLWEEDCPSALYPEELQHPLQVIEQFFKQYSLGCRLTHDASPATMYDDYIDVVKLMEVNWLRR